MSLVEGASLGAKKCCHIFIDSPFPTLHLAPLCNTSLPLSMHLQAYELDLESVAFIMEQCGKNLALNTFRKEKTCCVEGAKLVLLKVSHCREPNL